MSQIEKALADASVQNRIGWIVLRGDLPEQLTLVERDDLRFLTADERDELLGNIVSEEASRPLAAKRGQVQTRTISLHDDEHLLLLTVPAEEEETEFRRVFRRMVNSLRKAHVREENSESRFLSDNNFKVWLKEFNDTSALLSLPTDHPRPAVLSRQGGRHRFTLPPELVRGIEACSSMEEINGFSVLLTAWSAMLHRYAGQERLIVGAVYGEGGLLPLPLSFRKGVSFGEQARLVYASVQEAGRWAGMSLHELAARLEVEVTASHAPVVQTALVYREQGAETAELPQGQAELVIADSLVTVRDLDLEITAGDEGWEAALLYRRDLFEASTIERMALHFCRLLEAAVAAPEQEAVKLPLMNAPELEQLLVKWNDTAADYPVDVTLADLFEKQAARTPDAVAVRFEGETLTYRQLNQRANRLAHRLKSSGIGANVLVGVFMERSAELIVGLVAVMKAGGAYVPLDTEFPADRIAYLLADTGATVLLTQESLLARLPEHGAEVIVLDGPDLFADESENDLVRESTAGDLAYVLFTSGTTGRPKGVMVPQRAITNHIHWLQVTYRLGADDRVLLRTSLTFDISVREVFWPLACGAAIIVAKPGGHRDAAYLVDLVAAEQVTFTQFVTATMQQFLDEPRSAACTSLRQVFSGGETTSHELMLRWYERLPHARFDNHYGPTEATVNATYWVCEPRADKRVPIGRAVANTQAYVLDAHLQPVPVGVPGELYLGGAQIALGYWNRDDLTAERFVNDPFCDAPEARLYRTGDVVRWLSDGQLEFFGRVDHQVKIRGLRIELGEIESCLVAMAAAKEAVVLVKEAGAGDSRLVAYVTAERDWVSQLTAEHLRLELSRVLPDYMVPSQFLILDAMPVTTNGKIDRRALPEPDWTAMARATEYVAPVTPTEQMLSELWTELLGAGEIGRLDDFFLLGGHSLLAMRLTAAIRERWQTEVKLADLFERTTLSELAAWLDDQGAGEEQQPILRTEHDGDVPMSYAQQRMWLLHQWEPQSARYNEPLALRIDGGIDRAALESALHRLIERHEALRTVFPTVGQEAVQRILPPWTPQLPVIDLEHERSEVRDEQAWDLMRADAREPFELATGPLLRVMLIRVADDHHYLYVNLHHIVIDGWSISLLLNEWAELYGAQVAGAEAALQTMPVRYTDYAQWQRGQLQGERLAAELDYWTGRLQGAPAVLQLPTDHPRPSVLSDRGARHWFKLQATLEKTLIERSRTEGVTPYMLMLTAWVALLHRYSGEQDLIIGSPTAGRTHRELESVIGFFVNTLALRFDLSSAPTFRDLLAQVRDITLEAFAHQELPFDKVVENLQPERTRAYNPIFQVVFVYQEDLAAQLSGSALPMEPIPVDSGTTQFDLTLEVTLTGDGITAKLEYSTDLFEAATMERMADHFTRLLARAVETPEQPVALLPLMSEQEHHLVLRHWNDTAAEYPLHLSMADLFEEQVRLTPDAGAVHYEGVTWTYRELNERANRLAHALKKRGIGGNSVVGISMERSLEMVVALMGIAKAGGTHVPIDPELPADRIAYLLEDTAVSVILTQREMLTRLPEQGTELILMDAPDLFAEESEINPVRDASPEDLAFILYTSGTTGRPKGVMLHNRGLTSHTFWMQERHQLVPSDRLMLRTPLNFDMSVREVFWPLAFGASIVVAKPGGHKDPAYIADLITEEKVTVTQFVPSMLQVFIDEPKSARCLSLRMVVAAGEPLSAELMERWYKRLPQALLENHYGPTEVTIVSTYWPCEARADRRIPIGHPVANTYCYVLDAQLQPVPVGVPGELYIGGEQVSHGYWNREELTAERYVKDPFRDGPDARMYRSGDIVRWLPDGEIEYFGRSDNQVKIRGMRIELGEIESCLSALPSVKQAVVLIKEPRPGDKRLVAYVSPEGERPAQDDLRRELRAVLPEHMVPSQILVVDAMPITTNGKVDRRALPEPDWSSMARENEYEPPQTPTEEALSLLWTELLGVGEVGRTDDFFQLGGHSLLVMRLVAAVRETMQVELKMPQLFESSVLSELAAVIDQQGNRTHVPSVVSVPRTGDLPLSYTQQRLWLLHQFDLESALYNVPIALHLKGDLQVELLQESLNRMIARHESLRTVFPTVGQGAVQRVLPKWEIALPVADLRHLSQAERELETQRLINELSQQSFDLMSQPPMSAHWMEWDDAEGVLFLNIHHIIIDEWSLDVFLREFLDVCEAVASGLADALPQPAIQYGDYAIWQQETLQPDIRERQLPYWRDLLNGAPGTLDLPTDRPRPVTPTYRGGLCSFELPEALTRSLLDTSREEGVSLFMTMLTVWTTLLHRYSGQDDIVIGTPFAPRDRQELQDVIGFFVNTLPLRMRVSEDIAFRDLLRQVRDVTLGAFAHPDVPLDMLIDELKLERTSSQTPLVQALFVLLAEEEAQAELSNGSLSLRPQMISTGTAKFDLTLYLRRTGSGLSGEIEYAADLYDKATVERMIGHFVSLLEAAVTKRETPVATLPILSSAEREQLLAFGEHPTEYPRDLCIHQLFERQAAETPDHIALTFEGASMTYRELNRRANQVAHRLRRHGIGPDSLVGLSMKRSLELLIGILGILKAGGAYVPLDPDYPKDRLDLMIETTDLRVILTVSSMLSDLPDRAKQATLLVLDQERASLEKESGDDLPCLTHPEHLAYVMFTSGSTGRPKGVSVPHRGVVRLVKGTQFCEFSADETILMFCAIAFDVSTFEIWGALLHGGTLAIYAPYLPTMEELGAFIVEQGVTTAWLTAGLFHQLVDVDPTAFRNVRQLLAGGDVLSTAHVKKVVAANPGITMINGYGPTENTTFTTSYSLTDPEQIGHTVPIGRPIANTTVCVLDAHRQLVPIGVPGELYTGGDGLARDYLGQPEMTEEKFVLHPFVPGERLYRTGDQVRWTEAGILEFLGRIDSQVKLRGFRVEPGEIEGVLKERGDVRDAVVVVKEVQAGDKRLVAYLTADTELSVSDVRQGLKQVLPDYMIPSAIVQLDAFPLNANGKVDKRALPMPTFLRTGEQDFIAPRNEQEQTLAEIVGGVLKVEEVGVLDNLFDLGANSLLLTRIATHVYERLNVRLSLRTLFEAPTVGELAASLAEAAATAAPITPVVEVAPSDDLDAASLIEGLSDEEVERMLAELLAEGEGDGSHE